MAFYFIKDTTLTDIANAIREKSGTEEKLNAGNFADEIRKIEGGGGSSILPKGVYYNTERYLPVAYENNRLFTFKGDIYLWTAVYGTGNRMIYKYEDGAFTLVQTITYDSSTMSSYGATFSSFIELGDYVYFGRKHQLSRWNGTAYEYFNLSSLVDTSWDFENQRCLFKLNGKLYLITYNSTNGTKACEIDFDNRSVLSTTQLITEMSGVYMLNDVAYLITTSAVYIINSDLTLTKLASFPKSIYTADTLSFHIGNLLCFISGVYASEQIYTVNVDTGECALLSGYIPAYYPHPETLNGEPHFIDGAKYQTHLKMHIVE